MLSDLDGDLRGKRWFADALKMVLRGWTFLDDAQCLVLLRTLYKREGRHVRWTDCKEFLRSDTILI